MLEKRLVSKPRPLHLKTRNHRCLHTLHHHILHPLTLRLLLPKLPSRARVNILLPESLPKRPQTRLPPPRKTTSPFLPLRQILGSKYYNAAVITCTAVFTYRVHLLRQDRTSAMSDRKKSKSLVAPPGIGLQGNGFSSSSTAWPAIPNEELLK